jgi:hypothetical protein
MGTEIEVPFHTPYFYAVRNYSDERNVFHKLNTYNVHFQQSCLDRNLVVTEFQVQFETSAAKKKQTNVQLKHYMLTSFVVHSQSQS